VQVEELHPYQAQIAKHYSQLQCHLVQLKIIIFTPPLRIAECNSRDRALLQHQQLNITTAPTADTTTAPTTEHYYSIVGDSKTIHVSKSRPFWNK
jgi:hypothetical protein